MGAESGTTCTARIYLRFRFRPCFGGLRCTKEFVVLSRTPAVLTGNRSRYLRMHRTIAIVVGKHGAGHRSRSTERRRLATPRLGRAGPGRPLPFSPHAQRSAPDHKMTTETTASQMSALQFKCSLFGPINGLHAVGPPKVFRTTRRLSSPGEVRHLGSS